jgi:hypothetical protein
VNTIELRGRINRAGQLEVELPGGLPEGEVRVRIEPIMATLTSDSGPLSDEEIAGLMRVEPTTGANIIAAGLTGGWKDLGIADGGEWVEAARKRRQDRHI